MRELFAWLVEPCLAFLRREVSEMVSVVIVVVVVGVFVGGGGVQ